MKTIHKAVGREKGITVVGMVLLALLAVLVALFIMKIVPAMLEYFTVKNDVNLLVRNPELRMASVEDVRESFRKRVQVDNIVAISPADLEIGKENGELVIIYAYTKKIPLFGPVGLTIDFQGVSTPTK